MASLLMACATVLPAAAQTADTGAAPRAGVYLPEFFRAAAPANAYDMVLRLPGFSLVEADADVRGYAGASGNVLFDGARPTSKREDVSQQLKRIPAGAVERIELIYAGTPGVDMGGYAVLANVVRHREASTEWAVEAGAVAATNGWTAPQGQLEYGRRWNDNALDLSLKLEPELDDDTGRGHISTRELENGESERSAWDTRTTKQNTEAGVSWRQPLAAGRLTLTANLRGEDTRTRSTLSGGEEDERISEDEDYRETELAARYVRQFAGRTTVEAMASRQRGDLQSEEVSQEGEDHERFRQDTDTGETIGRIELTHAHNDKLSLLGGIEAAYNFLDGNSQLEENGAPVFLPGSRVRVEEQRAEASAGLAWRPAEAWTLEAGMRLEQSKISQTGDSALERRFTYPKPRVAVRWTPSERNQWRLAISREVGQLDFEDFAASASLEGGTVSAGNAELQPDRSWRSVLGWEHHFNEDAALTLNWTHDRISDVVDRVLVVDGDDVFDAPGNIGDGRRDTLALELATPLDAWGLRGFHLRTSLLYRQSRVTDPVTGEQRGISEEKPFEGEIELQQELPTLRMNWGVQLEHIAERETKYRYDRITRESEAMGWTLFAERRTGEHWRVRAEATDLFGRGFREEREKWEGTRADGASNEVELRKRVSPGFVGVTVRRSVGG
ncbi:TonB-dependent receptor plug domain-containing protein [Pseudoxanthomonas indica]|uniref:TonB-dependent receptor plug domain-containing protein n=1 Tax=Pseudoxanthomonas indica TaxID=428993 RepID=UPI0016654056|nr:TonB-dependent receptor [Pseudoxanthomonas indica]